MFGDTLAVEDVPDLADRHNREAGGLDEVHVGLCGRAYAVVVAVLVLPLVGALLAVVRTGDDALDHDPAFPYKHLVSLFAGFVQLLEGDNVRVGGDLEDGVGRGVDDPGPTLLLLRPELLYDGGARGR